MRKQILKSATLLALFASSTQAHALDQVIRPYFNVRSASMGGVSTTTGLYDQNFFGNPARVTANPRFRLTLLDPTIEGNSNLPSTANTLMGSGDIIQKIGDTAGDNNHGRLQTTLPGVYIPIGRWSVAFALITSTQFDVTLRRSYQVSPQAITDVGPAITVGRKFLEDDSLSVGATGHLVYRMASDRTYSFIDLIRGRSLSPLKTGGQGAMYDFDLGATYRLPFGLGSPYRYHVGASVNNLLGGGYDNLSIRAIDSITLLPPRQPRAFNVGLSATRESWWILSNTTFALEANDIGNNGNGSLYRLLHLGAETNLSVLAVRLGLNQGYWTAGLGLDLRFFTVDVATYGEEMSLNAGGLEDRRYALKIAFQI